MFTDLSSTGILAIHPGDRIESLYNVDVEGVNYLIAEYKISNDLAVQTIKGKTLEAEISKNLLFYLISTSRMNFRDISHSTGIEINKLQAEFKNKSIGASQKFPVKFKQFAESMAQRAEMCILR